MPVVSAESFLHSTRHGYCSASIERLGLSDSNRCRLDGNYSERVQYSLRKQSPSLLTVTLCYVTLRCVKVRRYDSACQCKCKQSPFFGVFWPLLSHPSTDLNETRTWSSYIKLHTHKLTPLNTYSLAFTGIIMSWNCHWLSTVQVWWLSSSVIQSAGWCHMAYDAYGNNIIKCGSKRLISLLCWKCVIVCNCVKP